MNHIELAMKQGAALIAAAAGKITDKPFKYPVMEIPKNTAHGDFASGFAMRTAGELNLDKRAFAQSIADNIDFAGTYYESASVAGPGFINLKLGNAWFCDVLLGIDGMGAAYGRTASENPEKIMVEYVSANPTGPMHMGNARGGVLGDSLSEILSWAGHTVEREFYVNDAGNQIEKFAQSILARYKQLILGEQNVPFPEDGYQGEDIRTIAKAFFDANGDRLPCDENALKDELGTFGLSVNLPKMRRDLERYKISYDTWFFESSLYESGEVEETVRLLEKSGYTYEKEDALWMRTTDFGCDKDEVLRRSNGFYTYFAADIAYHRNKFATRGFDRVIDIWGADHHGHVLRMQKALDAIGLDGTNRLEIVLMQMVRLMSEGEVVRMSKRTGKAISLSDLLDDIPVDAARYFFNMRASDTHLEFDLDLAVRQDSENPVYYVQYAHARLCSIMKALEQDGISARVRAPRLDMLADPAEVELIRALAQLPEEIKLAAASREPSRINRYVTGVAAAFHRFYTDCRIRDAGDDALRDARIFLCGCTATVLKNSLTLIGVTAPDHM